MKIEIDEKTQIAVVWSVEDVLEVRPDLTDDQAMEVLLHCKSHHDASIGISWDILKCVASILYPQEGNK